MDSGSENSKKIYRALDDELPLRLIIGTFNNPKEWELAYKGESAGNFKKDFEPKPEFIGKVVELTDDLHIMDFFKAGQDRAD